MNDPFFMRGVEGVGNLLRDDEGLADRKRAAPHALAQRLAFDQLEDDPADGLTALGDILLEAVHGADVGMIERRKHTRFALEARQAVGVGAEAVRQDFDGDVTAEARVVRPIDLAHPARPDPLLQLIDTESPTREHRHLRDADQTRGDLERIAVEEPVGCCRRIQQRVHFAPQTLVSRTRPVEKGRALFERPLECVMKQAFNLLPTERGHRYSRSRSVLSSSCINQARARRQSRRTVSRETSRTAAVSSAVRPPKKRISITRAFLSSIADSVVSASSSATRS